MKRHSETTKRFHARFKQPLKGGSFSRRAYELGHLRAGKWRRKKALRKLWKRSARALSDK